MYCVRCRARWFSVVPETPQNLASGYTSFVSIEMVGATLVQKSESSSQDFSSVL